MFVLLYWPLSVRPRQHDRFVLIGLCWLYGRSEFPPSPPQCSTKIPTLKSMSHARQGHVSYIGFAEQKRRVMEGSVPCPGQPESAYKGEKFSSRDRFRPC